MQVKSNFKFYDDCAIWKQPFVYDCEKNKKHFYNKLHNKDVVKVQKSSSSQFLQQLT